MSDFDRRAFILAAGGLPLVARARTARGAPVAPGAPGKEKLLPPQWAQSERLGLWQGMAPGHEGFRQTELPADAAPIYIQNVVAPELRVFRPTKSNGNGVLVIPGGAYKFVSVANEGLAVADRLCPLGYTIFVLVYRLPGEGWNTRADVPLQDAQRAMRVIRSRAASYGIKADTVGALGFSAGGHLAASLAVGGSERVYEARDVTDTLSARPHSVALIYPVVTMDSRWTHALSRSLLLGESPSVELIAHRSPNLRVDGDTPPQFIVHAIDDPAVPVDNSILMFEAMRAAHRPVEAHLLQEGGHAFSVGLPATPSALWIDLYHAWSERLNHGA